ncbi:Had-superfamily subfamily variant 1 [Colletotrichum higginsianum IMI 349063]|uniref:Had-superfamily subfamily variant 1 n=1 Tax=Colletotrichum higginsianum (strain IMI 349063) TaxID=759273 RepID=A0A1B7XTC0_COLHI|nr:Had-superfamily subfamily variant 1 [Colletotrichum higginsianum IMI 349063]OBR03011.1 Had-superfamily subfamily variant 1 [Colletotrichum higginsianum IMI 349063]
MPSTNIEKPPDLSVRLFVACPRSGSALLMRIFAENPECGVTSRLMLMDHASLEGQDTPNRAIFQTPAQHDVYQLALNAGKRFLISREELGHDIRKGECSYDLLPSATAFDLARPVFLIRDPMRVFDSWKKIGWKDVQSFIDCYVNVFSMIDRSASRNISCLLYEQLVYDPREELQRVCSRWGIPFSDASLQFTKPFGSSFLMSEKETKAYCETEPAGIFTTVEATSSIIQDVEYHGLLTLEEKEKIEYTLCRSYLGYWRDKVDQLRTTLSEKTWFGFDLDDTLHEFRLASSTATNKALEVLSQSYGTPLEALKKEYSYILRTKTSNAFSDGKTSFEYRRERFTLLLERISQTATPTFLTSLLEIYEKTLMDSLQLKCGAINLLATLKRLGKKIVIITEGPQDAQERTIRHLGIAEQVDALVTTNSFGLSKVDGLFPKVLQHLGILPAEMAYIGDSEQRDMEPALAERIFCIHFAETANFSLDVYPPRINTLVKLDCIISSLEPDLAGE